MEGAGNRSALGASQTGLNASIVMINSVSFAVMKMVCMYVGVRIVAEPIACMGNVWITIQRRLNV